MNIINNLNTYFKKNDIKLGDIIVWDNNYFSDFSWQQIRDKRLYEKYVINHFFEKNNNIYYDKFLNKKTDYKIYAILRPNKEIPEYNPLDFYYNKIFTTKFNDLDLIAKGTEYGLIKLI